MEISTANPPQGFSSHLQQIRERASTGPLTLGELLALFFNHGQAVLSLFLVIPFLQPIPLPGLSTAFGLTISLLGFFWAIDRPPWLPKRLANKVIDPILINKISLAAERVMLRLEHWVRPRHHALFRKRWLRVLSGVLIFVFGLMMSLPLPIPFSNFLPAVVIFLISLACLEEDLYTWLVGLLFVLINAVFFAALVLIPLYLV